MAVTLIKENSFIVFRGSGKSLEGDVEFRGLSTDTKPVENVINGAAFIEIDTSKIYFFDAANSDWIEWGAE